MSETITLPVRVIHKARDGTFAVMERRQGKWLVVSKWYGHSTSAFAALGRLTQKQTGHLTIK